MWGDEKNMMRGRRRQESPVREQDEEAFSEPFTAAAAFQFNILVVTTPLDMDSVRLDSHAAFVDGALSVASLILVIAYHVWQVLNYKCCPQLNNK